MAEYIGKPGYFTSNIPIEFGIKDLKAHEAQGQRDFFRILSANRKAEKDNFIGQIRAIIGELINVNRKLIAEKINSERNDQLILDGYICLYMLPVALDFNLLHQMYHKLVSYKNLGNIIDYVVGLDETNGVYIFYVLLPGDTT